MDTNDNIHNDDIFTLSQLLGGELTLVIPDMQRDYCWGNESVGQTTRKNKITLLVSSLAQIFLNKKETTLGLLYGYEEPKGSNRLLIIDGQQRITTLYLLIGMLYRRTPTERLRRLLISDYELIDNHEPRLLYQMRSEAMYFMSDLVTRFFLDRDGRLSQLEKSDWYYITYDSDPTVQSFINAIRLIDEVLEEMSTTPGWDFGRFADFVTERLHFMYHDLGSRQKAEDMFITINTTGEPLTFAQNVKSLLLATTGDTAERAEKWEELEQWAWRHRDKSDPGKPQTSDGVLHRFLRLWIAECGAEVPKTLNTGNFDKMYRFFTAYRRLIECIPAALGLPADRAENQFLILPTLTYINRWSYLLTKSDKSDRSIREFWGWLTNITRYLKVTSSGSDTEAARRIAEKMPRPDITSILLVKGASERLLNSEEKAKLTLLSQSGRLRHKAQEIIEKGQSHPMLNGKMQRVILWGTDHDGNIDLTRISMYIDSIYEIWGVEIDCNPSLDDLRRALLTLRHRDYPIVRRGETCLSLCWHDYDWQRLMVNAPGLIRLIIDRINQSSMPTVDYLRRMGNRFNDRSYPYYFMISNPSLIRRCQNRMLLRPCTPFLGFYLQDENTSMPEMRWFVEQIPIKITNQHWTTVRAYGARCLYTDCRQYNLSIDLYYTPEEEMPYRIELFARTESEKPRIEKLVYEEVLGSTGYEPRYDRKRHRHYITLPDAKSAVNEVEKVAGIR